MAGRKNAKPKVDPALRRQLDQADERDEPVEAVLVLNGDDGSIPRPEEVSEVAGKALERAQRQSGSEPEDVNIFRYMASFVVRAKPRFVRALLEQPEIASVVANRHDGEPEPVPAAVAPASGGGRAGRRRTRA